VTLSRPLLHILSPFRPAFTRPTWRNMLVLVEGALLARGRRTVTAALRVMGLSEDIHFNVFHHTLSRARWSALQISRLLLLLLVQTFVPSNAVVEMVVDETLERRWGPHIRKCAYYHDPVRSSQKYRKISRGLKWLCLMLIITPPWTSQTLALPILMQGDSPRHLTVHVDGAFKLANPLVSLLVDAYTLLEKRG
jgi:DDE superfamily endonuclease